MHGRGNFMDNYRKMRNTNRDASQLRLLRQTSKLSTNNEAQNRRLSASLCSGTMIRAASSQNSDELQLMEGEDLQNEIYIQLFGFMNQYNLKMVDNKILENLRSFLTNCTYMPVEDETLYGNVIGVLYRMGLDEDAEKSLNAVQCAETLLAKCHDSFFIQNGKEFVGGLVDVLVQGREAVLNDVLYGLESIVSENLISRTLMEGGLNKALISVWKRPDIQQMDPAICGSVLRILAFLPEDCRSEETKLLALTNSLLDSIFQVSPVIIFDVLSTLFEWLKRDSNIITQLQQKLLESLYSVFKEVVKSNMPFFEFQPCREYLKLLTYLAGINDELLEMIGKLVSEPVKHEGQLNGEQIEVRSVSLLDEVLTQMGLAVMETTNNPGGPNNFYDNYQVSEGLLINLLKTKNETLARRIYPLVIAMTNIHLDNDRTHGSLCLSDCVEKKMNLCKNSVDALDFIALGMYFQTDLTRFISSVNLQFFEINSDFLINLFQSIVSRAEGNDIALLIGNEFPQVLCRTLIPTRLDCPCNLERLKIQSNILKQFIMKINVMDELRQLQKSCSLLHLKESKFEQAQIVLSDIDDCFDRVLNDLSRREGFTSYDGGYITM